MQVFNSEPVDPRSPFLRQSIIPAIFAAAALFFIIAVLMLNIVPPVSRDAVTHHLAVPKIYFENGGIKELPHIRFSYYPMNLDLLYTIALWAGWDSLAKYIHFLFGLLTAGLLYVYVKQRISKTMAAFAVLLFISTPVILKLSISVYVDLGLVFFILAAFLSLMKWRETGFAPKWLIISAVFCGLGLGTKYNALISFILLSSMVPLLYIRDSAYTAQIQAKAVFWAGIFIIVSIAVFSPWMVRNIIWKQNPVFPLYNTTIQNLVSADKQDIVQDEEDAEAENPGSNLQDKNISAEEKRTGPLSHFVYRKKIYGESLTDILLIPLRIFFTGKDDVEKRFDGKLNPLLLFLAIAAFFPVKRQHEEMLTIWFMAGFCVLTIFLVFFQTDMRIRYVVTIVPLMCILSAYGLRNLVHQAKQVSGRGLQRACFAIIAMAVGTGIFFNGMYLSGLFQTYQPFAFLRGEISRDGYLNRFFGEYETYAYINNHLPEDARIYAFFIGNRRYYCNRHMDTRNGYFLQVARNSEKPKEIYKEMDRWGITHFLIRIDLFYEWSHANLEKDEFRRMNLFFKRYLHLLYIKNGYGVFLLNG